MQAYYPRGSLADPSEALLVLTNSAPILIIVEHTLICTAECAIADLQTQTWVIID